MLNFSKKGFAVSGAVIGVAFFTIAILILAMQVLLSTGKARLLILQEINKTLPVRLSVEKYHLSLFTGLLDLSTIQIQGKDNKPILLIDHFQTTISFLPLLKGELIFNNLLIENPTVWFRPDNEETLKLLDTVTGPDDENTPPSSDGFPANVRMKRASLTGGRFHYAAADSQETCDIEGISLNLIDGDLLEESGKLTLNTGTIAVNGPEIKLAVNDLKFEGVLDSGQLNPASLMVRTDDHLLDISGHIADIFTLPVIDLGADLVSQLGPTDFQAGFEGTLTSHIELEGSGISAETFTLKCRLETVSPGLSVEGVLAPSNVKLNADVGYQNKIVTLNHLDLNISALHLTGTGDYDTETDVIKSSLTLEAPELADIDWESAPLTLGGLVNFTANISGKLEAPRVDGRLQGRAISINGTKAGDIDAALALEDGRLIIEKCDVTNGKSMVAVSGAIDILDPATGTVFPDPALALRLVESSLYPEDFFDKTKGEISVTGRVDGSMNNPQGFFSLTGKKIDTGVQTIEDAKLVISFDRDKINLDNCVVTITPGQQIKAMGMIRPIKNDYDLHVVSNEIALNSIDALRNLTDIAGKIVLDIKGKGSLGNPVFEGGLVVTDLTIEGGAIEGFQVDLGLKNNDFRVEGDLGFNLKALYNLDSMDFKAEAGLNKRKLRPLFELLGNRDVGGSITGKVQAEGNAGRPELIVARADIKECSIHHNGIELIQADAFSASLEKTVLTIPGIHLNFQETGSFDLSGKGELDGAIDFAATGTIPAETLLLYTDVYPDIAGLIELAGSLKGTFTDPKMKGHINLIDIELTVPELMQRLYAVNGDIIVTPEAVSVETLHGMLDDGEFRFSGNLTLENFMPGYLEAKLIANALPVTVPETMEMLLNTELVLRGTPGKSFIEGSIVILEGRYYKDVSLNLLTNIGRRTRQYKPDKKDVDLPFLNNTGLKIKIQTRTPLEIDNNIAVMTLQPDLSLSGTVEKPLIRGRASVPSGIIIYQDKDFQITKGVVDFINPYKIEPEIDIAGQVDVEEWTIYLEVSGKPDNLEFELSSDPAEEHWDILSLLAFGKTAEQMTGTDAGGELVSPKQMIADVLAKSLQEKLQSETTFDSIEMAYSENTDKNTPDDIKVVVGKKLAERLTLKYGVETRNGVTVQSADSEYQLLESLLMKAFQDTAGDFGGELVFRLEFR